MLRKYVLAGLAALLLFTTFGITACGSFDIPGRYVNDDYSDDYLELNDDGTFVLREMGITVNGAWTVENKELRLKLTAMTITGWIQGDKIIDDEGIVWYKESSKKKDIDEEQAASSDSRIQLNSGAVNPFIEMLSQIPDTPETREVVYINDYSRIRQVYGIELPPPDGDAVSLNEYIKQILSVNTLSGMQTFIGGFTTFAYQSPIKRENIGFGPQDVDQETYVGHPPNQLEVVRGNYQPERVGKALGYYYTPGQMTVQEYQGTTIYDFGYDGSEMQLNRRLSPPFFDNLGRCRQLGVWEGYAYRAADIDSIKMMIDAAYGSIASLATNPDFSIMATKLDEMDVFSAGLFGVPVDAEGWSSVPEYADIVNKILEEEPPLKTYDAWATGTGKNNEGPYIILVVVYGSAEDAESDVEVLRERVETGLEPNTGREWNNIFTSYEVWHDGRVIMAKFRSEYEDISGLSYMLQFLLLSR